MLLLNPLAATISVYQYYCMESEPQGDTQGLAKCTPQLPDAVNPQTKIPEFYVLNEGYGIYGLHKSCRAHYHLHHGIR